jgi:cell division protease FtsH
MVVEYGMSEAIGPINLAERRSTFLNGEKGLGGFGDKNYSEQMQRRIDDEVSRLLEEAMTRARDMVSRHRDALGKVAARLLAIEVIEGDELRRILVEAGAPVPEKRGPAAAEDDQRGEVIAPVPPQGQAAGA